jgi:hypothetical protein
MMGFAVFIVSGAGMLTFTCVMFTVGTIVGTDAMGVGTIHAAAAAGTPGQTDGSTFAPSTCTVLLSLEGEPAVAVGDTVSVCAPAQLYPHDESLVEELVILVIYLMCGPLMLR